VSFDIRTTNAFVSGDTCTLGLRSVSGRIYDTKVVTF
jgi:hypothetical protein